MVVKRSPALVWTNSSAQIRTQSDTNETCDVDNYKDLPRSERCECSKQRPHDSFVNWASFYYCVAGERIWAFPVLLLAIFFTFTLLASTADQYLVPSLEKLSSFLNLSPNVAGVTLLAFGNGAPDVFSSFAALTGQSGDSLGISAILGAGVFVTTIVLAACIVPSEFRTHRRPFVRDVMTYIFGVALLLIVFLSGEMKLWQSLFLFISYFLYVLVVIVGRYYYQKYMKPRSNATPLLTVAPEFTGITPSPSKDAAGLQTASDDDGQSNNPQTVVITSAYTPDAPESEEQDGSSGEGEGSKGGLDDLALYHAQVSLLKTLPLTVGIPVRTFYDYIKYVKNLGGWKFVDKGDKTLSKLAPTMGPKKDIKPKDVPVLQVLIDAMTVANGGVPPTANNAVKKAQGINPKITRAKVRLFVCMSVCMSIYLSV